MTEPVRVAHLVSHPIPYFAPLYRELASRPEIDLTVFFYSAGTTEGYVDPGFGREVEWDTPLLDGYRYSVLPSAEKRPIATARWRRPNFDLIREVDNGPYDVIWVHGYAHFNAWLAFLRARRKGRTFLLRDEPTLQHARPAWRRAFKSIPLRLMLRGSGALYIGEENRRYLEHYGMPPERMFPAPYCVDNEFFRDQHAQLAPERPALRKQFGIDDDSPVVLFCGKFIPKKQPLAVIRAFARVRQAHPCWLLMVGDGPLMDEARAEVERESIPNVLFAGFLNQKEIPRAYTAADLFVLFSGDGETWGLVVNEAMNFGLPVIVSNKVGCGRDLVREGENGFIVSAVGVDALSDRIEAVVTTESGDRARLGSASLEIVNAFSIETCADGIVEACTSAKAAGA